MKAKLFQYAIIWHPEEKDKAKKAIIVQDIKTVLAKDPGEVGVLAAREIPEKYLKELDQIEIAVKAF